MRIIKNIVVHCTATVQTASVQSIQKYWKDNLGWQNPGYHKLIDKDGGVHILASDEEVTNGVKSHNQTSLHVSYIGGLNGHDTRTAAQKDSLWNVIKEWKMKYPNATVKGHRDFEGVTKECPAFNAIQEYSVL